PPAIVHSVAENVREPDVPGVEVSTVSPELGVVIRRWRPIGQRSRSRVEIPPPFVAVAHGHLAAEFDDLSALRHLNENTAFSGRSELVCDHVSPGCFSAHRT